MASFTLNTPWYELVKDGKKTYEGRRKTDTVKMLEPGDVVQFFHHTDKNLPRITAVVEEVLCFPTFKHALEILPIDKVLPLPGITIEKGVEIYKQYVSIATQERDGVAMIKIRVLDS